MSDVAKIPAKSLLFMLAFDHRQSIRSLFGIPGKPTSRDAVRIADAKRIIFDGLLAERDGITGVGVPALLVDDEFGSEVLTSPVPTT